MNFKHEFCDLSAAVKKCGGVGHRRKQNLLIRWTCILFLLTSHCLHAFPDKAHEGASYDLRWAFVPVGQVEIHAHWQPGCDEWHFSLTAHSNAWMDRIMRTRTSIISRTPADLTRSLDYLRTEAERDPAVSHHTIFDWTENTVRYSRNEDERLPLVLPAATHDPLSIVFFVRQAGELREGMVFRIPVTDGQHWTEASVTVSAGGTLKTPFGRRDTWLLEADLHEVRAVFARPEGTLISLWLDREAGHLPLKLVSEAPFGRFTAEIRKISSTARAKTEPAPPEIPAAPES